MARLILTCLALTYKHFMWLAFSVSAITMAYSQASFPASTKGFTGRTTLSTVGGLTSSPTPGTTAVNGDDQCFQMAAKYVLENNLCSGASHPTNYSLLTLSHYSCENRCGERPAIGHHRLTECGCDHACALYGDCCRDMATECPDILTNAINVYGKARMNWGICDGLFMFIRKNKPFFKEVGNEQRVSTVGPGITRSTQNKYKVLPYAPRTLEQYFFDARYIRVIDRSTGITFRNFVSFLPYSEPNSSLLFVPRVAKMYCQTKNLTSSSENGGKPSAANLLKWCKVRTVRDGRTPYDRVCQLRNSLECGCGSSNGKTFLQYVHNACLGDSADPRNRHNKVYAIHQSANGHLKIGQCEAERITTKIYEQTKFRFEIYLYPIIVSDTFTWNNFSGVSRGDLFNDDLLYTKRPNVVYGVGLRGFLETRLHCKRLKNYLSDCVLTECENGAVLVEDGGEFSGRFGGRACIMPVAMAVSTKSSSINDELCVCLRVQTTLYQIQVWHVRRDPGAACLLWLSPIMPQGQELGGEYTFAQEIEDRGGQDSYDLRMETSDGKLMLSNPQLTGKFLVSLNKTQEICPYKSAIINICFHSKSDLAESICVVFSGEKFNAVAGRVVLMQNRGLKHTAECIFFLLICVMKLLLV